MKWILILIMCGWTDCDRTEVAAFHDKASCEAAGKEKFSSYTWVCGEKE